MVLENITLGQALTWLLAACTAVVTLSKVWDIIAARFKPGRNLRRTVEANSQKLDRDKERLDEQERANAVVFRALYALINHEISGNGDDILRRARDEIQDYLTQS